MGCHFLLQGDLPDPGIEPECTALQADALPSEPPGKPLKWEYHMIANIQWKPTAPNCLWASDPPWLAGLVDLLDAERVISLCGVPDRH